jgi:predicted choloylglycine hydrolase
MLFCRKNGLFSLSGVKGIILHMYIDDKNNNFCISESHMEEKSLGKSTSCSAHFTIFVYLQSFYTQSAQTFAPTDLTIKPLQNLKMFFVGIPADDLFTSRTGLMLNTMRHCK